MLFSSSPYAALPVSNLKIGTEGNVIQLPVWNILHVLRGLRKDDLKFPYSCMWAWCPYWKLQTTCTVHQNLPIWLPFPSRVFSGFCLSCFGKALDRWVPDTKSAVESCPGSTWVAVAPNRNFFEVTAFAPNSPTLNWRLQHSDFLLEPRKGHCRQTQNYLCWCNLAQGS